MMLLPVLMHQKVRALLKVSYKTQAYERQVARETKALNLPRLK